MRFLLWYLRLPAFWDRDQLKKGMTNPHFSLVIECHWMSPHHWKLFEVMGSSSFDLQFLLYTSIYESNRVENFNFSLIDRPVYTIATNCGIHKFKIFTKNNKLDLHKSYMCAKLRNIIFSIYVCFIKLQYGDKEWFRRWSQRSWHVHGWNSGDCAAATNDDMIILLIWNDTFDAI